MLRVRFLRVLLPLVLLPFLVVLALQLQPKERVHSTAPEETLPGVRAEGIRWSLFDGDRRSYSALVNSALQEAKERFRLEGVRRFEVEREGAAPLIISANLAGVVGAPGERTVTLQGGVRVSEEERGITVSVAELEVDQASGEARSVGIVELESPDYRGTAERVIYGLEGQPTRIVGLRLDATDGGRLTASRGTLHDGTRDVELEGRVRLTRGEEFLAAERLRLWRVSGGGLQRGVASRSVTGALAAGRRGVLRFESDLVEVAWDDAGEVERLRMEGRALLLQAGARLSASRIAATRQPEEGGGWEVQAEGAVSASGALLGAGSTLEAQRVTLDTDPEGALLGGEAAGAVSFRGEDAAGEAEVARFRGAPEGDRIVLESGPRRRARLARGQTRVVADRIVTDRAGIQLDAEGRVESTLLPGSGTAAPAAPGGLFRGDEAVHFVASRLRSRRSGAELEFEGNVRAWQGERTLSAERVDVQRTTHKLTASGSVATRLPRDPRTAAVAEQDFVQISAEHLEYAEERSLAVYTGDARIRQTEGWLHSRRLEVQLRGEEGEGIEEVRAFEEIRFEYRATDDSGMPTPVSGEGDRVVYTPDDHTVRLFGDRAPATIRRSAARGGNASGRALIYRLDVGSIRVDSGDQDRVRIITSGDSR